MNEEISSRSAIELLQALGLKEYEARCFVALSRMPRATAKEISRVSEVPRTRVYDATRVLESKGLIEVNRATPQEFRANSIDEAVTVLQNEYQSRTEELSTVLRSLEPVESEDRSRRNEIWSLSGRASIENRVDQLIGSAESEVILAVPADGTVSQKTIDVLERKAEGGAAVSVVFEDRSSSPFNESVRIVTGDLPQVAKYYPESSNTTITRILLVDQKTVLLSSVTTEPESPISHEAVFARGQSNPLTAFLASYLNESVVEPSTVD